MGRPILFKCPNTGMNVQHWLADDAEHGEYQTVTCPACNRLHFVRTDTGKLLGRENE